MSLDGSVSMEGFPRKDSPLSEGSDASCKRPLQSPLQIDSTTRLGKIRSLFESPTIQEFQQLIESHKSAGAMKPKTLKTCAARAAGGTGF